MARARMQKVKWVQLGNILKPPPAAEKQRGGRFDLETRAVAGQRAVTPPPRGGKGRLET